MSITEAVNPLPSVVGYKMIASNALEYRFSDEVKVAERVFPKPSRYLVAPEGTQQIHTIAVSIHIGVSESPDARLFMCW